MIEAFSEMQLNTLLAEHAQVVRADSKGSFPVCNLPFIGHLDLYSNSRFQVGMFSGVDIQRSVLFIGVVYKGAYGFTRGDFVHQDYAMEKLNLTLPDAACIADFINDQFGLNSLRQSDWVRKQRGTLNE